MDKERRVHKATQCLSSFIDRESAHDVIDDVPSGLDYNGPRRQSIRATVGLPQYLLKMQERYHID